MFTGSVSCSYASQKSEGGGSKGGWSMYTAQTLTLKAAFASLGQVAWQLLGSPAGYL